MEVAAGDIYRPVEALFSVTHKWEMSLIVYIMFLRAGYLQWINTRERLTTKYPCAVW
jgi:hypothetical protein